LLLHISRQAGKRTWKWFISCCCEISHHAGCIRKNASRTSRDCSYSWPFSPSAYKLIVILYYFIKVKVKVKLSLCLTKHHTMKTYWGSGDIAPRILWPRQ
jgi:hypothetical protein